MTKKEYENIRKQLQSLGYTKEEIAQSYSDFETQADRDARVMMITTNTVIAEVRRLLRKRIDRD